MATRVAALELSRTGIRINGVAPGTVLTAIVEGGSDETGDGTDRYDLPTPRMDIPMGRDADPEEIAGTYLFLASTDASYVTGHLLFVDGDSRIL
jgi:NAD(P)-dependent dehydrogenase (short-subunit alcohol dehydrogenase family)